MAGKGIRAAVQPFDVIAGGRRTGEGRGACAATDVSIRPTAGIAGRHEESKDDRPTQRAHDSHIAPFASSAKAPYLTGWRESRIGSGGNALAVFEYGNPQPSAPALLLIHGLAHWTQGAWDRLVRLLDPALRIVAFDLPGFGASDKPNAAYDAEFFVNATERVAAALPDRFAVCGHSLGGAIAARYAGLHPARVAHLTLIAPAGFAPRRLYGLLGSPLGRFLLECGPPKIVVDWVTRRATVASTSIEPEEKQRSHAFMRDPAFRRSLAAVYRAAISDFAQTDRLATLARYRGPVLIGWGRNDRYVPIRVLAAVCAIYPQAVTEIFERSAHLPMIEEPQLLATAMNAALTSRPSVLRPPGLQK